MIAKEQWIPWEISYSLKETSRINSNGDAVTSKTNAILAVVIPDSSGSCAYYTFKNHCCKSNCRSLKTDTLFQIMKANMFNIIDSNKETCQSGTEVWHGESSYIVSVEWDDFISNIDHYINKAYKIQENIDSHKITKEI